MKLLPESPAAFLAPLSKPPERLFVSEVEGPFMTILLAGTDRGLMFARNGATMDEFRQELAVCWGCETVLDSAPLLRQIEYYEAYFAGDTAPFDLFLQPFGVSLFTLTVHRFLTRIPFGATMSYGDIAEAIGHPGAARAVGTACGKNRALIAIPCHRVVASNGIGGFGGGLDLKKRLLAAEGIDWRRCGSNRTINAASLANVR